MKGNKLIFLLLIVAFAASVSAVTINQISISPKEVSPGEKAIITIEIKNTLDEDAKNINVALDLSSNELPVATFESSSEDSIDELKEGNEELFNFNLIILPNAASGIYKIPIKISYFINGQKQEKTGSVGIIVNSEPKLAISSDSYLIQGVLGKVALRIVNDGLSDIKFLSISAEKPANTIMNPPLYKYIGNIDSDDSDSIEYEILTDSSSSVKLPIIIKYKDATNKDFVKSEILMIPVYTKEDAIKRGLIKQSRLGLYIAIIIFLIILYVAYRVIRSIRARAKSSAK